LTKADSQDCSDGNLSAFFETGHFIKRFRAMYVRARSFCSG